MTEEQIAALQQRLEYLEAQNEDYASVLNMLRTVLELKTSRQDRQQLLRGLASSRPHSQVQIWRFVLGEVDSLDQGYLDLGK